MLERQPSNRLQDLDLACDGYKSTTCARCRVLPCMYPAASDYQLNMDSKTVEVSVGDVGTDEQELDELPSLRVEVEAKAHPSNPGTVTYTASFSDPEQAGTGRVYGTKVLSLPRAACVRFFVSLWDESTGVSVRPPSPLANG